MEGLNGEPGTVVQNSWAGPDSRTLEVQVGGARGRRRSGGRVNCVLW